MSVHTRMLPIKKGSHTRHNESKEEKRAAWREIFKHGIEQFSEVGLALRGARYKSNMTQKELAEKLGIYPHHISEMEHGKRPIGKAMAHKLAKILRLNYKVFL